MQLAKNFPFEMIGWEPSDRAPDTALEAVAAGELPP
jgi:hypothetical protein